MNTASRKNRQVFRPSLSDATSFLEERVVLSTAAFFTPLAAPEPTNGPITRQLLQRSFTQQSKAATTQLRNQINAQITTLFANGQPTTQQLNDFRASVGGLVNATSFRLSSQNALLPRSQKVVQNVQSSLLSGQSNSLLSRINNLTTSTSAMRSARTLQTAINGQITRTMSANTAQLNNFFSTTPINRLSVDASGQRISLQQFIGNRAISQFGNMLGALANSFGRAGTSLAFPNGTGPGISPTAPSAQALANLQTQFQQGLGLTTAQLGNSLSLIPGIDSNLFPQLQSAFFGTGTGANSLINSLQGLNLANPNFSNNVNTSFNRGFNNVLTPLNNFFGFTPTQASTLPNQWV